MTSDERNESVTSEIHFPKARRAAWIMFAQAVIPSLAEHDYQIAIKRFDQCVQECMRGEDPEKDPMLDELEFIRAQFVRASDTLRASAGEVVTRRSSTQS